MPITDQVATAPCTDPIQVRFVLLMQSLTLFKRDHIEPRHVETLAADPRGFLLSRLTFTASPVPTKAWS